MRSLPGRALQQVGFLEKVERCRVADPVPAVHLRATKKQVKVEVQAEKNHSTWTLTLT